MGKTLKHIDLCSGIGGFALGFEWAGLSRPVLFCDIEPWSRKVLAKHWPNVPIAEDVKELASDPDRNVPDCDILTAGYPCQPFSLAGERRGTEDDRHIWPYIFTIIQRKRPSWCVFENVYGHVSMGLDEVLSDLEAEGYATRTFIVPACGVDAPHRRDRLWIIAHTDSNGQPDSTKHEQRLAENVGHTEDNGRNRWATQTGREGQTHQSDQPGLGVWGKLSRPSENVADTDSARREEQWWGEPAQSQYEAAKCGDWWLSEPPVGRLANGIPNRVDQLKGLGNAIVPQIAMRIGQTIKAVHYG